MYGEGGVHDEARHNFTVSSSYGDPLSLGGRASRNSRRVSAGSLLTLSAFQRRVGLYHTPNSISTMSPTPIPVNETPFAGGKGISIVPIPTTFPLASAKLSIASCITTNSAVG